MSTVTAPTRSYRTFKGYYTDANCGGDLRIDTNGKILAANTAFTANTTLYACWEGNVYTITLDQQSGSGGTTIIYEKYATGWYNNSAGNNSITTIAKPTRANYAFEGYYTSANCEGVLRIGADGKIIAENTTYTSDGELYACWMPLSGTMQSFSCSSLETDVTVALTDTRDKEIYTVFKGKDGKCWMSQDLRLVGPKTITNVDSNIAISYDLPAHTWSGSGSYTSAELYDSGDIRYGVYYNFYAASAGTISGESNTTNATYDICPKGWKMPSRVEAQTLLSAYDITNSAAGSAILRSAPLSFTPSGYISYSSTSPSVQGKWGYWWTSTAFSGSRPSNRYVISDIGIGAGSNSDDNNREGLNLRCVTK